jgi:glycosyltransferase involved in cell wall biosynthesis
MWHNLDLTLSPWQTRVSNSMQRDESNTRAKMRIILVADNASSQFGGEAFIPLNYFRLLRSRKADVRLVVHARNKAELVKRFPEDLERLHFVEDTWLHKILFRLGTFLPRRLAESTTGMLIHLTTQLAQRRVVRRLVKTLQINVVHQPIPVSPKAPSLICGVEAPVIIGPLNGGMEYPPAFQKGFISNVAITLGRAVAILVNLVIPGKRLARLILVANRRTRDALPWGFKGHIIEMVENGVDLSIWQQKPPGWTSGPGIRLIFIGRLIDLKALDIVLEAIHRVREQVAVSFEIIGDGPMRQAWQEMTEQLGLGSLVQFSGFMSQPECARRLKHADVFVMPSLIECGGAVVLEAMAAELPVIATAWGGPLDYLDETCGILVKPESREALISGFSDGIVTLAKSEPLRKRMGQAGREHARQNFDWERKIDRIMDLYASVNQVDASRSVQ